MSQSEFQAAQEAVAGFDLTALKGQPTLQIRTSGATPRGNPGGPLGFAANFEPSGLAVAGFVDGAPHRTNFRAAIGGISLAVLVLLRLLGTGLTRASLGSDNEYALRCASRQWRPKTNQDLWEELTLVLERVSRHVRLTWQVGDDPATRLLAARAVPESKPPPAPDTDYRLRVEAGRCLLSTRAGRTRLVPGEEGANQAAYATLCAGVESLGHTLTCANRSRSEFTILVESANLLLINQLSGRFRPQAAEMRHWHARATALLREFRSVEYRWGNH